MYNRYELNDRIDGYVDRLAASGLVKNFYPIAISKALDLPLTTVLKRLDRLVEDGILNLKFEIRCHECLDIVCIVDDYSNYLDKEIYCQHCDKNVYVDLSNIFPIYYIDDDYKKYLKKKTKSMPSAKLRQLCQLAMTI